MTAVTALALLISKVLDKARELSTKFFEKEVVQMVTEPSEERTPEKIPQTDKTPKQEHNLLQELTANPLAQKQELQPQTLQTYFCARFFRNEEPIVKSKKGAVILVGGGDGHIDKAYSTACTLLHHMNCSNIHEVVYSHNTNTRPAINDKNTLMGLNSIYDFFMNNE